MTSCGGSSHERNRVLRLVALLDPSPAASASVATSPGSAASTALPFLFVFVFLVHPILIPPCWSRGLPRSSLHRPDGCERASSESVPASSVVSVGWE